MRNETVEKFYRKNYDRLIKYARSRVGGYSLPLAEDAVQEAFARALRYYRAFNERNGTFEEWFSGILRNTINYIKSIEQNQGITRTEEQAVVNDKRMKAVILSKEIIDELKHVSDRDRSVFEAYFFYGLKTREISEIMPISHSNVRYLISKFREKMTNNA